MRKTTFGKVLGSALLVGVISLIVARPLVAQSGTTNIQVGVPTAASITVTNTTNPVVLTQSGPATFSLNWVSPVAATTVAYNYRATKGTGAATMTISATAFTGAVSSVGAPALSNLTATATVVSITSGTLVVTAIPMALAPGTNIFTDGAGSHAKNQSFTVTYTLAQGDYAADTYSTVVTYTFTVT